MYGYSRNKRNVRVFIPAILLVCDIVLANRGYAVPLTSHKVCTASDSHEVDRDTGIFHYTCIEWKVTIMVECSPASLSYIVHRNESVIIR
jgi:hypothetical protein